MYDCLFFRCLINVTCATNSLPSRRGLDYTAGPTQVTKYFLLTPVKKKMSVFANFNSTFAIRRC
jgi:hypothetical protein